MEHLGICEGTAHERWGLDRCKLEERVSGVLEEYECKYDVCCDLMGLTTGNLM